MEFGTFTYYLSKLDTKLSKLLRMFSTFYPFSSLRRHLVFSGNPKSRNPLMPLRLFLFTIIHTHITLREILRMYAPDSALCPVILIRSTRESISSVAYHLRCVQSWYSNIVMSFVFYQDSL